MTAMLRDTPVLVLNQNYQPLNVCNVKRAIILLNRGKAEMMENGIRFKTIGRIKKLPDDVQEAVHKTIKETSANRNMVLTLALSYGGRQEIFDAIQKIAKNIQSGDMNLEDISEKFISDSLYTRGMPDPDLLIRTSGEYRISNFMLWQMAYTEIYITPTLWPDFRKEEYLLAIEEFQKRERRFGATGEQLENNVN